MGYNRLRTSLAQDLTWLPPSNPPSSKFIAFDCKIQQMYIFHDMLMHEHHKEYD